MVVVSYENILEDIWRNDVKKQVEKRRYWTF